MTTIADGAIVVSHAAYLIAVPDHSDATTQDCSGSLRQWDQTITHRLLACDACRFEVAVRKHTTTPAGPHVHGRHDHDDPDPF